MAAPESLTRRQTTWPAAVLFDMDGTLVDTEPYWIDAEYQMVESFGGTWSDEHAHNLVGSALLTSAAYLQQHGGVPLPAEQIVAQLLEAVIERMQQDTPWRPGARELLRACAEAAVPTALVTMSYENLAETMVGELPAGTLTTVVAGDHVTNGKPHPEPYLLACERLGVDPRDCVAVEDSPTGVASALAAGCVTVGVPHHVPLTPAPGLTLLPTLAGVGLAQLAELVTARRRGGLEGR